ncbi:hypothetical protein FOXYS1_13318 [Fusarium oxysporum]|uniref:Uncharacterized protein n=1 Tax=Fusarium oxysporum TaxID=5507 RepID=A0A8H5ED92_FUSOX|nr:hypothetical protein FOXYS1_13318 [Fusarium oxysporum]
MRNRSSTNDIILAIKHIEVKAAAHIDKPLPPKHNTLTTHQQGQVGHNVEHQKHSGATLNFGVHEGVLQTFDPRDQALLDPEKPYDQRYIIIDVEPGYPSPGPHAELVLPRLIASSLGALHNLQGIQLDLWWSLTSATVISKTGPPSNQNKTTGQLEASHLVREKRKEAALGRQRAHARADTSEMNMVAMNDPTDGLRWAFHLTLSGLWDSFLPSPTSQVTYIAFEFLKH